MPSTVDHSNVSVGTTSLQNNSPGSKKGSDSLVVDVTPAAPNFPVIENFSLKTALKGVRLVDEQGFPVRRQKLAIEQILPTLLIDFPGSPKNPAFEDESQAFGFLEHRVKKISNEAIMMYNVAVNVENDKIEMLR